MEMKRACVLPSTEEGFLEVTYEGELAEAEARQQVATDRAEAECRRSAGTSRQSRASSFPPVVDSELSCAAGRCLKFEERISTVKGHVEARLHTCRRGSRRWGKCARAGCGLTLCTPKGAKVPVIRSPTRKRKAAGLKERVPAARLLALWVQD